MIAHNALILDALCSEVARLTDRHRADVHDAQVLSEIHAKERTRLLDRHELLVSRLTAERDKFRTLAATLGLMSAVEHPR